MLKIYSLITFLLGIAGAAAVVYGVWQIDQPVAWIVAGLMGLGMSFIYARGIAFSQYQKKRQAKAAKTEGEN